jgi:hypothetical protein
VVLNKRKAWKWIATAAGVPLLLIALAPYLASVGIFRETLLRAVTPPIHGSVHCGGASLGWFSPIQFDEIEIRSADGAPVVAVDRLQGDRPLWKMLVNRSDLGRFRIERPQLDVVLSPRGANLAEVFIGRRKDKKERPSREPPNVSLGIELIDGRLSFRGEDSPRAWTAGPINLDLALQPASASPNGQPELVIEPGIVLPQTAVTPDVCRDLLKYIAPVLADVTEVSGDFSIEVDRWRLPLAEPAKGEGSGRLVISSLDVGPGPLVAELSSFLKTRSKLLVVEKGPVAFHMADGRIHHGDFVFRIEGLTVRTHGSVGLDKSLALVAEVPMPGHLLGDGPVAAVLSKQTLTIPIGGTLSKPRIDAAGLGDSGMDILSSVLGEVLQGKKIDAAAVLKAIQDRRRERAQSTAGKGSSMNESAPLLDLLRGAIGEDTPLLERLRQRRQDQDAATRDKK